MPDLEKVIEGLEYLITAYAFHGDDAQCLGDAMELLKEQEPIEPNVEPAIVPTFKVYSCGHCDTMFHLGSQKYCANCGRKVKWDAD